MKTSKSVTKRLKLRKSGKVTRRAMALGHNRANKSTTQRKRKKQDRGLEASAGIIKKYL